MRKLILFISVIVVFVVGWIFYLNQNKKNFIDNLPQLPVAVNQPINNSSSSGNEMEDSNDNEMEDSNDFVEGGRIVKVDHETLQQEQNASAKKTPSETPSPDEKADFVRDQWIQMFGDIPEVHDASEYMRKIYKKERRMTIDEVIAGLEASHYLFPYGGHGILLEMRKSQKAQGIDEVEFMYEEDLENVRYAPDYKVIHLGDVPEHLRSDAPTPESIDEDIDFPLARSEGTPVMMESKTSVASDHVHLETGHVHEPSTIEPPVLPVAKSVESGWEGLSFEQREQAKKFFDEYGTEEGLRRFRDTDPEAARQFERERRKPPVPSEPSDEPSTQ